MIIGNVSDKMDLLSISCSSRSLRRIAEPLLYRQIDINSEMSTTPEVFMDSHQVLSLYKSISTQGHASLVTELRVYLLRWQICSMFNRTKGLRMCSCDAYDKNIGLVLLSLPALQTLVLWCDLCGTSNKKRHPYIAQLNLPGLKSFSFTCHCSNAAYDILALAAGAPNLTTVTNLSIDCNYDFQAELDQMEANLMDFPGILPNVTSLMHNGSAFADAIILARSVSKVYRFRAGYPIEDYPYRFHSAVCRSTGTLTALYSGDLLTGLSTCLELAPNPYRHLNAIGTLIFTSYKAGDLLLLSKIRLTIWQYSKVLEKLSVLAPLEKLQSIEVDRGVLSKPSCSAAVCSKAEFRDALVEQHPSLRLIIIAVRGTLNGGHLMGTEVWRKASSEWIHESIPYYTYWDVMNGAYDSLW